MIEIVNYTTKTPLAMIGKMAGICWNSNTDDVAKNIKRAKECIDSGHGRTEEFPDVYFVISGFSARVCREFYTHIGGSPTRLQESTRYCNCEDFNYVEPNLNDEQASVYKVAMDKIKESYKALLNAGVSKEDAANVLPLGMYTKVVCKMNLRTMIDMSHMRLCNRAYWEYRELMKQLIKALSEYSDEWFDICKNYMKPKCEVCGFCIEAKCCGHMPTKKDLDLQKNILDCADALGIPANIAQDQELINEFKSLKKSSTDKHDFSVGLDKYFDKTGTSMVVDLDMLHIFEKHLWEIKI